MTPTERKALEKSIWKRSEEFRLKHWDYMESTANDIEWMLVNFAEQESRRAVRKALLAALDIVSLYAGTHSEMEKDILALSRRRKK